MTFERTENAAPEIPLPTAGTPFARTSRPFQPAAREVAIVDGIVKASLGHRPRRRPPVDRRHQFRLPHSSNPSLFLMEIFAPTAVAGLSSHSRTVLRRLNATPTLSIGAVRTAAGAAARRNIVTVPTALIFAPSMKRMAFVPTGGAGRTFLSRTERPQSVTAIRPTIAARITATVGPALLIVIVWVVPTFAPAPPSKSLCLAAAFVMTGAAVANFLCQTVPPRNAIQIRRTRVVPSGVIAVPEPITANATVARIIARAIKYLIPSLTNRAW